MLALTFTRKAASELGGRLSSLGLSEPATAGTFHAVALGELRRLAAERGRPPPVLARSKASMLAAVAGGDLRHDRGVLVELASEIEWARARCLTPREYVRAAPASGRKSPCSPLEVSELWKRYEREKQRRGVLDFDDLLDRCTNELEQDPDFAASARWRFRHLFVDEFQDVNPAQLRLLEAWLGVRDDLCVVGDPNQAIYAWNGSDPRALVDFPLRYPAARIVRLATNYRSAEAVIAVASSVLKGEGVAAEPDPDGAASALFGAPAPGRDRAGAPLPSIQVYETDDDEARGVATAIRKLRRPGDAWSSLAVLARTNAQLTLFERELGAAGIPCRSGGGRAFLGRPSVRRVLDRLSGQRPDASGFRGWLEELEISAAGPAGDEPEDELGPGDAGPIDDDAPPPGAVDDDRLELARLAHEYAVGDPNPNASGFVSWLEASLRSDPPRQAGDAVDLLTFHRAKGLEWRTVFVTGLEEGLVPIAQRAAPRRSPRSEDCSTSPAPVLSISCIAPGPVNDRSRAGARRGSPSPYLAAIEATHRRPCASGRADTRTAGVCAASGARPARRARADASRPVTPIRACRASEPRVLTAEGSSQ